MSSENNEQVIRDPLWNTIRLDHHAVRIVNTAAFQRQRYIRQLGFAHLVYPGATHTRFGHAIGVYHLAQVTLEHLRKSNQLGNDVCEEAHLIPYAALLHDIGHYAFSHALEELGDNFLLGDHEAVSARFLSSDQMKSVLKSLGDNAAGGIHDLIRGESTNPLRGLVSGSLDLDKIEYLKRDARFCGVPYGEVDVDRLLQGMLVLEDPTSGKLEI
ncbi:MAG TPA: HD domain-containing protein, partial [Gemmatimonadetes bacterium]|nr:HD domain-containing protein [Gemmatimonadota bacterium]